MLIDHTYISWWPEPTGRVASLLSQRVYEASPFRNRSYKDDVNAEGQGPDHSVRLDGLDERSIRNWWQGLGLVRDGVLIQGPLLPWGTLRRNCANIVAEGLRTGGGDRYANWTKSWNLVWTPADVLAYALSIQRGLLNTKR
jgi:hypothetical protein